MYITDIISDCRFQKDNNNVWEGFTSDGVRTPVGQDQGQTGGRYYHH